MVPGRRSALKGSRSASTAPSAGLPACIEKGLFEKYEVMRGADAAGHGLVDEVEVEKLDHRFAHAPVLELRFAGVHHEADDARGALVRHLKLDHVARGDGRKVVAAGPFRQVVLAVGGDAAAFHRFEDRDRVGEVVVADGVEVPHAPVHGQVLAPPVRVAAIGDADARIDRVDDIGARAGQLVQRRRLEVLAVEIGLPQDRAQAKDQRQFAVFGVEGEADAAVADGFCSCNLLPGAKDSAGCRWCPSVSKDHSTSSTVTGLPSENRAPSRRVNSTKVRASSVSIDSARSP